MKKQKEKRYLLSELRKVIYRYGGFEGDVDGLIYEIEKLFVWIKENPKLIEIVLEEKK